MQFARRLFMKHICNVVCCLLIGWPAFAQSNANYSPTPASTVVPAGTHVLMQLMSPLHTTSATNGSAVYLEVTMPVILDQRVVIPAHTHVTGTVAEERRPGRVKGRARLRI